MLWLTSVPLSVLFPTSIHPHRLSFLRLISITLSVLFAADIPPSVCTFCDWLPSSCLISAFTIYPPVCPFCGWHPSLCLYISRHPSIPTDWYPSLCLYFLRLISVPLSVLFAIDNREWNPPSLFPPDDCVKLTFYLSRLTIGLGLDVRWRGSSDPPL